MCSIILSNGSKIIDMSVSRLLKTVHVEILIAGQVESYRSQSLDFATGA
jgi:hypothetical protein